MLRVGEKQGVELALRKAEHEDEEGRSRATSNRNSSSEEMAIRLTRGDNLPAAESISSMDSFEQSSKQTGEVVLEGFAGCKSRLGTQIGLCFDYRTGDFRDLHEPLLCGHCCKYHRFILSSNSLMIDPLQYS
jgi:hypothetical protein